MIKFMGFTPEMKISTVGLSSTYYLLVYYKGEIVCKIRVSDHPPTKKDNDEKIFWIHNKDPQFNKLKIYLFDRRREANIVQKIK